MKIKDMLKNLIKEESNRDSIYEIPQSMLYDMKLQEHGYVSVEDSTRFTCYWLANHYCTDTYVGVRCYLLDGKPVAMSHQAGRKCDENIEWVSEKSFELTRQFVISLLEGEEELTPKFLDMEEEMGVGYPVQYVGQLLTKSVLYDGCMVLVTKEDSNGYRNFHEIEIKHPTKGLMNIDIRDILVPWNA